jgi:pimeloyl-ACP methyl ester carboxylesterase
VVAALGGDAVTLDLPSNHVDGAGFTDDVAAVRALLDGMSDVVLVGHSYGGAVISEAGAHDNVAHLVFLCAFAIDAGESLVENPAPPAAGALESAMRVEDGHVLVDPEGAREAFYGDCAEQPVDRLVPHSMSAFTVKATAGAWRDKPSTYVLCTQDKAIHPDRQRFFANRCSTVVELDASHSPMLSMPDRVAEIIRAATT